MGTIDTVALVMTGRRTTHPFEVVVEAEIGSTAVQLGEGQSVVVPYRTEHWKLEKSMRETDLNQMSAEKLLLKTESSMIS